MRQHRRAVVSAVLYAVVVAMTASLVLFLGSAAQAVSRPHATVASPARAPRSLAELIATDPWPGDDFGWSVAVSGSTAVVGAPYADSITGVLYTGAAYVFTKVGSTWTEQAELNASDAAVSDGFGSSVAISGTTVVVGAPGHDVDGAAYVFTESAGVWTQRAELTAPDVIGEGTVKFGYSVLTSGSAVMVGATGAHATGAVYVYSDSSGTWTEQAELTAPDAAYGDLFGWSLALSRSTLVVGAVRHDVSGAVYVFTDSSGSWIEKAELTPSDGAGIEYFGDKVATDGTHIVVGMPGHANDQGAVYVFTGSATTWIQRAELTASDGGPNDCFGWAVGLSGTTILVGAEQTNNDSGAAYVFSAKGAKWRQRAELKPSDGGIGDEFGYSASLSGTTAIVGSNGAEGGAGSAYLYQL
jgi:hypothetical protein